MNSQLLKKLFIGSREDAIKAILNHYHNHWNCSVNFLYFANAMRQKLFEQQETSKQKEYFRVLHNSDFLLADGIALQIFTKATIWSRPNNLNGTDFTPAFLAHLFSQTKKIHVALRSVYDEKIGKPQDTRNKAIDKAWQKFVDMYGQPIDYSWQCHYSNRSKGIISQAYEKSVKEKNAEYNILLNCTWTPFQEVWTEENANWLEKNNILILNIGWFIDFFSGFESRAPDWVVRIRVGETLRRIARNPRKNLKKLYRMFWILRFIPPRKRISRKK